MDKIGQEQLVLQVELELDFSTSGSNRIDFEEIDGQLIFYLVPLPFIMAYTIPVLKKNRLILEMRVITNQFVGNGIGV